MIFFLNIPSLIVDSPFFHNRTIHLPGDAFSRHSSGLNTALDTLASVPWFLLGIAAVALEWISSRLDRSGFRGRRGYRNVPIDEDAQILRFEDEEE